MDPHVASRQVAVMIMGRHRKQDIQCSVSRRLWEVSSNEVGGFATALTPFPVRRIKTPCGQSRPAYSGYFGSKFISGARAPSRSSWH